MSYRSTVPEKDLPSAGEAADVEASGVDLSAGEVDTSEFEIIVARGALLVDVRDAHEFEEGHLEGASLWPLSKLETQFAGGAYGPNGFPSTDTPIAVYCLSGRRSGRAAKLLRDRGYHATSLRGGLERWIRDGRAVSTHGVPVLSSSERARYRRQTVLPELGEAGQARLLKGRVLIIGAGGLGSPVALYLAAAGVGTIGLVDDDEVDLSNLQRQVLYGEDDVGKPKAKTAAARLTSMNADVKVIAHATRIDGDNARALVADYDIVCDCSDNFETRYAVNAAAMVLRKPLVHGAIHHFDGEVSVFGGDGPCYRCLHREAPARGQAPSCAEAGVIGAICGVIGSLQAMEVVKLLTGIGEPLRGRVLSVDLRNTSFFTSRLKRDEACPCCAKTRVVENTREF